MAAPAPSAIAKHNSETERTILHGFSRREKKLNMSSASLPVGAKTIVRISFGWSDAAPGKLCFLIILCSEDFQ